MTSTTTRLQAVQKVLRNVAEVNDIASTNETTAAIKASNSLEAACRELANEYDWSWLYTILTGFTAGTWAFERFTFVPPCKKVLWVKYGNITDGYITVPPVTIEAFHTAALQESTETNEAPPSHYMFHDNTLSFNPYPADTFTRTKVLLGYIMEYRHPTTDGDTFTMDEPFLDAAIAKATYHMCIRHSHDTNEAQFWQAQYDVQLRNLKSTRRNMQFENMSFFNNQYMRKYGYKASI